MDYNILRLNDIRGEYPKQINKNSVHLIGNAIGYYLKEENIKELVLGYDNRLSSEELFNEFKDTLLNSGINVISIGLVTTPILNYTMINHNILFGLMITASHNQSKDNGIKIFGSDCLHLKQSELAKIYDYIKEGRYVVGHGNYKEMDVTMSYVKMLIDKIGTINKKVVVDCGNGTGSVIIKSIFDRIFLDVTYINCESDGSFPVHNPDPNEEENLGLLKSFVKLNNADLGIAVDGDADRVGIIDEKGNMIATDFLMAIFAKELIPKSDNKNIIIDVKCSTSLEKEIKKAGGNPVMVKNGSAYIERIIKEKDVIFGGEFSGHIFFRDDFYGFDDGIYASLRVAKLINEKKVKVSSLTDGMERYESTPEIRIKVFDDIKFKCIDYIKEYVEKNNYNANYCDGVRVNYEDGFALVRCSNTGPFITARFEAKTSDILDERKNEFLSLINNYIK